MAKLVCNFELDSRDWEIIKDVLEAHLEVLEDMENDGMLNDSDELSRVRHMIEFINSKK